MSEDKYHTIDPLILETLNLNEKRMNYILDILHGRDPKEHPRTERKHQYKSLSKNKTIATITHDDSMLPLIPTTTRKPPPKELPRLSRSDREKTIVETLSSRKSRTIEKTEHQENKQKRYERNVKSPLAKPQKTLQPLMNIQQQVARMQWQKKAQLMKDYMAGKLKKSRSMEINPQDLYRIQIQHLVAQLTPIELLQQAERKMVRLKKRYKHLATFDKHYYSKLCQGDMLSLS